MIGKEIETETEIGTEIDQGQSWIEMWTEIGKEKEKEKEKKKENENGLEREKGKGSEKENPETEQQETIMSGQKTLHFLILMMQEETDIAMIERNGPIGLIINTL